MDIIIRPKSFEDISLLEMYQNNDTAGKPMVILYHGYLARKEFILPQAYLLASHGYFTVIPDTWGHGDRSLPNRLSTFFESVLGTTEEIDRLIKSYEGDDRTDTGRVGLAGYSMGGCITFNYLARENRRVKAAVTIIGTPDWESIMNSSEIITSMKSLGLIKTDEDAEKIRETARLVQPKDKYENISGIPLLIQAGEADGVIPVAPVKNFYEKLVPFYTNQEELKLLVYPGVGHGDNIEMNQAMVSWFYKYL